MRLAAFVKLVSRHWPLLPPFPPVEKFLQEETEKTEGLNSGAGRFRLSNLFPGIGLCYLVAFLLPPFPPVEDFLQEKTELTLTEGLNFEAGRFRQACFPALASVTSVPSCGKILTGENRENREDGGIVFWGWPLSSSLFPGIGLCYLRSLLWRISYRRKQS